MTTDERIASLLKRLKARLKRKAPDLIEEFGPPCDEEHIRRLEQTLGAELPADVRAFYRVNDGAEDAAILPSSEEGSYGPLSLAAIAERWESARQFGALPAGFIPIATDGAGNYECVDLSVGANACGRIVEVLHETGEQREIAPSLEVLLAELVEGLESRKYRVAGEDEEDVGVVRVDPNAPPPRKKRSSKAPDDTDGLWHALRLVQEESPSGAHWPVPPSPELAEAIRALDPDGQHFGKAPGARLTALFKLRVHGAGEFFKYAEPRGVVDLHGLRWYPIRETVHLNKDHWVPPPKRFPLVFATTLDGGRRVAFDLARDENNPPVVLYPAGLNLTKDNLKQVAAKGRVIAENLIDFLTRLPGGGVDLRG